MVRGRRATKAFVPNIARARQMIEMGAEIAVGRAGEGLEPGKVEAFLGRVEGRQRGHHPQAHRLVDDLVGRVHEIRPAASRGRRR